MEIGPLSAPYLLVPIMAMAQVVNVSRPGEEPDPAGPVPEDVRLHDSSLADSEGMFFLPCYRLLSLERHCAVCMLPRSHAGLPILGTPALCPPTMQDW